MKELLDLGLELDFEISFKNGRQILKKEDFAWNGEAFEYYDKSLRFEIVPEKGGYVLTPIISSSSAINCDYINMIFSYRSDTSLEHSKVFSFGQSVFEVGLCDYLVEYLKPRISDQGGLHCGIYNGADRPCVFFGSVIPLKNNQTFKITPIDKRRARIEAKTLFLKTHWESTELKGERIWISTIKKPLEAFDAFISFVPEIPAEKLSPPCIGWNSWECYFDAITQEDILENVYAIANDPDLKEKIKYIIVDDGWQHCWGEWHPNYRFSKGMDRLAEEIKKAGFTPGIWVNGPEYAERSYPVLTKPYMFVRTGDRIAIDPTHPEGAEEIYNTFRRLYSWGYRVFKVDYVSNLLQVRDGFYDKSAGVYDAVRELFRIIRSAVGEESHIIGCAYPFGAGAECVDSSRVGVDIHSHWNNVKWVCEYLQATYFYNGRLFRCDPDFITVRGRDTADVVEEYKPVEYAIDHVWNEGEYFTFDEAETWARMVRFFGGNIFVSDEILRLNEKGRSLLLENMDTSGRGAIPVDFGEKRNAELWYAREESTLLVINFDDDDREFKIDLKKYGIDAPKEISASSNAVLKDGIIKTFLRKHQSIIIKLI